MTTVRTWGNVLRRPSTPAAALFAINGRPHRTPIDLLQWSTHHDAELTEAVMPAALNAAETVLLVHDGRVRAALDRQEVRGHVLATSAARHLDDPVLASSEPVLELNEPAARPWLNRWNPLSLVSLPLSVDGHCYGVLLALTYTEPCDTDALQTLRACAERAALRLALRDARQHLALTSLALDAVPVPAAGLDADGRVRVWNNTAEATYTLPASQAHGRHLADLVHTQPETDELAWQESTHRPITAVRVDTVERDGATGIAFTDLTAEIVAAEGLARQHALAVMLLESVPGRACVLDADGIIVATNESFDKKGPLGRGRRSALALGSDYLAWLATVDESLHRELVDVLDGDVPRMCHEIESTYRRQPRWTELYATGSTNPEAAALVLHIDITERKELELDLEHRATHDPLTGLPNRVLLVDRLQHALTRAARSHTNVGIVFCDLDRFKDVNTQFGHAGGDELLIQIAKRLKQVCRTSDTVARVSGDEFVLLLEDVSNTEEMEDVAARVLESLVAPVELEDGVAHTGASIGMVLTPGIPRAGMGSVQKLVRQVDAAMYAAKDAGRNQFAWFSPEMLDKPQARPNFLEVVARRLLNR
ncbi:MAG: sensor domain-containing diguanylate cyclase [Candidatus Nanopelagicales bacterium]